MAVFVTGATGMLGQEIVPRMVARGDKVYALSRNPEKDKLPAGVIPVKGDISLPRCGLREVPPDVSEVWHMAALTSFRTKNDDILDLVNHMGTVEAVDTFREVQRFIYVSTIYVCGDTHKPFSESDFNVGQRFRNRYESSKYQAEGFVRDNRPDAVIFRPGILVGRYSDASTPSFSGFYRPVKAVAACHRFAEQHLGLPRREVVEDALGLPRLRLSIRCWGEPEARLPVAPLDWAAEAMLSSAYMTGKTLHIIPADIPKNREVVDGVNEGMGVEGFHFCVEHRKNPLDHLYNRLVRDYLPYVRFCPVLGTSVGHTCPPVDRHFIARVVHYWRNNDLEFAGGLQEVAG